VISLQILIVLTGYCRRIHPLSYRPAAFVLDSLKMIPYNPRRGRFTSHRGRPIVPPATLPAQSTEERLIEAAVRLFAGKWYGTVSVAAICRSAGLSNGVFYRYFNGKEELFRRILVRVLDMIRDAIDAPRGKGPRERLRSLISAIVDFSRLHPDLVAVFREGQYRFFEYERQLVSIYERGLSAALGREVGLPEYLFALGGVRFCAIRSALHGIETRVDDLDAILCNGLFRGMDFDPGRVFGGSATPLPVALEESARGRLLDAGKRLFGEKGFFETNIHEVTDKAGLSVGAFYTYFPSKEIFFAEIIRRAGHDVRAFIARNLIPDDGPPLNRLERELRGLWLWVVFLSLDKDCYTIVREAEFVLPSAVREYYGHFVEGYRKNPDGNGDAHQDTAIEFLLGIAHYFGIEAAFDTSPWNARAAMETIGAYLSRGFSAWLP
jgi:AcrR family transcriptional regulator